MGTVSNIVIAKKYGFITGENGREYFFHRSSMYNDSWDKLVEDFNYFGGGKIKVSFEPIKAPKGPRAEDVRVVK